MSISNLNGFLSSNEFKDLTAGQKRKWICPIGKMPRLALNQVIQSMNHPEQIKLALTSKRMEYCVKTAKIKVESLNIHFRDELSNIQIKPSFSAYLFCGSREVVTEKGVTRKELEKWCEKDSVTENIADVYKKLQYLIPSSDLFLVFVPDEMKNTNVKEVLSIPAFQKYKSLQIGSFPSKPGKISSDDLKQIMKTARSDIHFAIFETEVSVDFRSEYAFKFNRIDYEDARWVQVEDLYRLHNNKSVILGKNNFSCSDFNALIKYWVNSDSDMFNTLQIEIDENIDLANIFNDLVVLESSRFGSWFYFLAANFTKNRKKTMLCIGVSSDVLQLRGKSPNDSIDMHGTKEKYIITNELEILQILGRKKELMKTEDGDQEIRDELQELDDKLEKYEVHLRNGRPSIN